MNDIFRLYLNKFVIVYLDNILIFSKNEEKHVEHIRLVMKILRTNDFYVKSVTNLILDILSQIYYSKFSEIIR